MSDTDHKRQCYEWGLHDGREGLSKTRNRGFKRELQAEYDRGYTRGEAIWAADRKRRQTPA